MTRQLCFRGMRKILLRYNHQQLNYSWMKFPSNLNCDGKIVSEMGHTDAWSMLTHWGRVTHICVVKQTIIGSDNGLSPGRRQAIIWTNAGILLIGPLGTNFSQILIGIQTFSLTKMASAKWRPFCLSLNVLTHWPLGDASVILKVWFKTHYTD